MKRKAPPKTLVLHGVYFIIAGIILMLFPLNYLDHMGGLYSDLAGFLLMAVGLVDLHLMNIGFSAAAGCAVLCALGSLACVIFHVPHLVELLPTELYSAVLFFMCTSFKRLALLVGDEHSAHHFISHMKLDIVAMVVEIAVHAAELPHWVGYIAFAFALYAEVNLMILMWRFRKTGSGKLCKEAENNTGCAA